MPTAKVSVKVKEVKDSQENSASARTTAAGDEPRVIDLRSQTAEEPPIHAYDAPRPSVRNYDGEIDSAPGRDVPTQKVGGILDIAGDGHGFLRPKFRPSDEDVYISASQIRRFALRAGDVVEGMGRPPKDTERYYGLLKVETINGGDAEKIGKRTKFEDLTPIYPNKKLKLETVVLK